MSEGPRPEGTASEREDTYSMIVSCLLEVDKRVCLSSRRKQQHFYLSLSGFDVIHFGMNSNGPPSYFPKLSFFKPASSKIGWNSSFFHVIQASTAPPLNSPSINN